MRGPEKYSVQVPTAIWRFFTGAIQTKPLPHHHKHSSSTYMQRGPCCGNCLILQERCHPSIQWCLPCSLFSAKVRGQIVCACQKTLTKIKLTQNNSYASEPLPVETKALTGQVSAGPNKHSSSRKLSTHVRHTWWCFVRPRRDDKLLINMDPRNHRCSSFVAKVEPRNRLLMPRAPSRRGPTPWLGLASQGKTNQDGGLGLCYAHGRPGAREGSSDGRRHVGTSVLAGVGAGDMAR